MQGAKRVEITLWDFTILFDIGWGYLFVPPTYFFIYPVRELYGEMRR